MINLEDCMTKRRRRSKKWISWLFILMLLIAAIVVCSMVYKSYFSDEDEKETSSKDVTEEEKKEDDNNTEEEAEEEVVEKEEIPQYDGEDPNNSDVITGAITYTGVSGSSLMIRLNIDQYLSDGVCNLRIHEYGSEIYSDSVSLVNSASTTTCEGFDVPVRMIGGGDFQIYIDISANGKSGTITGEVSI